MPRRRFPSASGPDRIETTAVVRRSVDQQSEVQLPTEIFAMGSRMQQLADVDARAETADALVGKTDQFAQSENRGSSNIDSTGMVQNLAHAAGDAAGSGLVALPSRSSAAAGLVAAAPVVIETSCGARTTAFGGWATIARTVSAAKHSRNVRNWR